MMDQDALPPSLIADLERLSTCRIANALEQLSPRLRNEGFTSAQARCLFPEFAPMVGYAVPAKLRAADPPLAGYRYQEHSGWWDYIASIPHPRVVVLQDTDQPNPGIGALIGEVHAHILRALGCTGVVTNGAVRDLVEVRQLGFHFFAQTVAVSHAYAHLVEVGAPVTIGGLRISAGDLIHGDRHGIINVPKDVAAAIPATALRIKEREQRIMEICASSQGFMIERLRQELSSQH